MVDMAGKNLKALYNNELYKVGWLDTIKNKIQIILLVCENGIKTYHVSVVKINEVILVLEE
jgi:hypothetical protein